MRSHVYGHMYLSYTCVYTLDTFYPRSVPLTQPSNCHAAIHGVKNSITVPVAGKQSLAVAAGHTALTHAQTKSMFIAKAPTLTVSMLWLWSWHRAA